MANEWGECDIYVRESVDGGFAGEPFEPCGLPRPCPRHCSSLTDLVRERYETGRYGECHLLTRSHDRLRDVFGSGPRRWGYPVVDLLSIPVVLDGSIAEGRWRLVKTDGTVVGEGVIGGERESD